MTRRRVAIVGLGRLGAACLDAIRQVPDLDLAGVVRRPESGAAPHGVRTAAHVRDLGRVDAALVCVPAMRVADFARELLQARIAVVECAVLEDRALDEHYAAIGELAQRHRTPAVVGAGWNPGMLPLLRRAFEVLVPEGRTSITDRPGANLHHTEAVRRVRGVRDALVTEQPNAEGRMKRYVYAELAKGTDPAEVQAALAADPLFAGEETLLFPVESVSALEAEGRGVLLERRGTARSGAHQNLLLEARFDVPTFAARVMVDTVRRLGQLRPGAHRYSLWAD
jgi:diaminopimelate dehydrogenase